ncbi:hypothetical protein BpHYR1_025427 [Brachionus plicatilis]|uniref:Uncharacterized protein n=1 Tax=Brachionus plicatilis TaxID=10195 RepID=A0A3M7RBF9_BRAPC|nr:hypothetical protein BpHYR1_025427 [Brachionus plicatilis]
MRVGRIKSASEIHASLNKDNRIKNPNSYSFFSSCPTSNLGRPVLVRTGPMACLVSIDFHGNQMQHATKGYHRIINTDLRFTLQFFLFLSTYLWNLNNAWFGTVGRPGYDTVFGRDH